MDFATLLAMLDADELDVDGLTETGENIAIFRAGDWVI